MNPPTTDENRARLDAVDAAAANQPVAAVLAELSTHHDDEVPL